MVDITVIEKYAQYEYQCWAGKTVSTCTTNEKIIDENGNIFIFTDERLWALMRVNSTYTVRYSTSMKYKTINAVKVGEMWYWA